MLQPGVLSNANKLFYKETIEVNLILLCSFWEKTANENLKWKKGPKTSLKVENTYTITWVMGTVYLQRFSVFIQNSIYTAEYIKCRKSIKLSVLEKNVSAISA